MAGCLEAIGGAAASRNRNNASGEGVVVHRCRDRRQAVLDVQRQPAILKGCASGAVVWFEPVIKGALQCFWWTRIIG